MWYNYALEKVVWYNYALEKVVWYNYALRRLCGIIMHPLSA